MLEKLGILWAKIVKWNRERKALYRLYLALLIGLGLLQGIISLIVLLLPPDKPVGSR